MKNYQLSIIIPHYNSSKLLEKLLSTIPQDEVIQVIVVDDKSQDIHVKYIKYLQTQYSFEFYKNNTNQKGAGAARNVGLNHVNGTWILFADSDDYFVDTFYDIVSEYFNSNNDMVFFKATSVYIDSGKVADRHVYINKHLDNYLQNKNLQNELHVKYSLNVPWAKIIKRDLIVDKKILFDEILVANDVMFTTKVSFYIEKFEVVDQIIYIVTKRKGSLTTKINEKLFDFRFNTIISMINFLKQRLPKEEIKLLNISRYGRYALIKSMDYGILKTIKVLNILLKNGIGFFHYKLLNPIHIFTKISKVIKKNKIESKYNINEK